MSHTTPPVPSRNPSVNGPLPNHPPPPIAPTTLQKFLGFPTVTSVHFAFTLFALVEVIAFTVVRSGAVAFLDPPQPLAVLLFICLFSLFFWHQRRCVRDLLTRTHPDCEAGLTPSAATGSVADAGPTTALAEAKAEAVMSPEGEELFEVFNKLQTPFYAMSASIMLITGCWLGIPGLTIAAGSLFSLVGFLWFLWVCCWEIRQSQAFLRERGRLLAERRVILELQKKLRECRERLEQRGQGQQSQEVEGSAVRPSESREDVASSGGEEIRGLDLPRRRLSCIVEEEDEGPSENGGDKHPPTPLVLSQQAQDLVWNRVRYLAARETLTERGRKKLFVRPAMREMQGESAPGGSGDGGFYAPPADSAQSSQEADPEGRGRDRQGQGAGLRRVGEERGGFSGGTQDDGDTSGTFSSGQPSSTTMPTRDSNPIVPVPQQQQQQQQTFPAMENPPPLPAAMDRTDASQQRQQQQQERHIEAITRLAHAKDSEIATLRTHMEGMTKHFRTREESYRAAHAAEVANAWRNAQVLFEKVGKLEGKLSVGISGARKEAEGEERVWTGARSTEQEERIGREMGIFAKEGKGEGWAGSGSDFGSRQQQQGEVVEEENESDTQDVVTSLPLCQNTGCFCHFPVASPQPQQQQQQQQQRQERTGSDGNEVAITSPNRVDELDEDRTDDDDDDNDDDAFTIIVDGSARSSSSSSSSSSPEDERPGTLTPTEGSEITLSAEWEMDSDFDSESGSDGLDDRIHV
ncbi:hypothetical protein KC340_g4300 [Hortaea werneckii]|nr:hypothetical protein KC342_g4621 [Hortaea werneckii]KAI7101842.1 hypothetical protein KC339_g6440 [Hortaea werneckii]KAI7245010.1 hypothetical protein KC365_g894 [Hortaea werneckii]KAI7330217.1 hypothetical protein KC340_g4300 [Hortaea werneckii]